MIKCNDELELRVEKLTYQGSALARTEDGFVVFVKNAAPCDLVKVKITKANKNWAVGEIIEILEESKHRKKPICPLFNACGSCSYQYVDYDFLLQEKNNMLKEAFYGLGYDVEFRKPCASPKIEEYRHKIQYRVSETKNSKRLLVGYFKEKSHDIVNIKFCPIQPKIADEMAEFLRQNWSLGGYVEKTHKGLLRSFIVRFSSDLQNALVTLVLNLEEKNFSQFEFKLCDFAKKMSEKFPQIKGVSVNFNSEKTNNILGQKFKTIFGEEFIYENLGDEKKYKISPSSFFQVNPHCAKEIFDEVKGYIDDGSVILDAYGGVGAIGIWCASCAKKVVLVEESESSIKDAKENFKLNNVEKYEIFLADAKAQFRKFIKEKKKFSHIIIDPPRKGCDREALEILSQLGEKIIYVSCNPQTLVRDLKILGELGFVAKSTRAFDMFPFSYHIESVTMIEKEAQTKVE